MTKTANQTWDVVIMGGGFAGQTQARHLMRQIPGIRIAMVEPRSLDEIAEIRKIGESTVEIAATFIDRELGLYDYLVENHQPKVGLAFHWPKSPDKTDSIEDYASLWPARSPTLPSWQIHRGRFERDLMQMNLADGLTWIQGTVQDMDLTPGAEKNTCTVQVEDETIVLECDHLVDAAGRSFLTGRKTDNMLVGPKNLFGLKNGTAWVRVSGVDRLKFVDGIDAERTHTSQYYSTNHFFGAGHWLWMIPIGMGDTRELSIGVMYHHDVIRGKDLDSEDKFKAFLKANHTVLHDLIDGCTVEDFVHWSRPAHYCKKMFSEDRWYAMGDAAYFGDAFYSQGTSTIAFAVESITELIKTQRAGGSDWERKRDAYNRFNLWWGANVVHLYREHANQLADPGVMSWRIYLEYTWWFGAWVPTYLGKFFLDPQYVDDTLSFCQRHFLAEVYEDLNKVIAGEGNPLPFMDCYRADQLAFGFSPSSEHDHYLENVESAPQRLNVYRSLSKTFFFVALWWLRFQWTAFGFKGLLRFRTWRRVASLVWIATYIKMGDWRHVLWTNRGVPRNQKVAALREEVRGMGPRTAPPQPWIQKAEAAPKEAATG
jgi:flavin-dependent dehydrogenase